MRATRCRGLTLIEIIVVIGLVSIIALLLLMMSAKAKVEARHSSCQNNLQAIGRAMYMYADVPANGGFPNYAQHKDNPFASDPLLSWGLLYNKYVQDPRVFSCPGNPVPPLKVSTWNNSDAQKPEPVRTTFAYDPGHSPSDANVVIAGDMPGRGVNSDNHGEDAGQNVLMTSGVAEFRKTPANAMQKYENTDIYSINPEIPRSNDSFIRQ